MARSKVGEGGDVCQFLQVVYKIKWRHHILCLHHHNTSAFFKISFLQDHQQLES